MFRTQLLAGILALTLDLTLARPSQGWGLRKFKSLVTFGDSYTDDSRLGYFINHNGSAPPVGWVQPESNSSSSGGYTWGHFVAQEANVNRYNYAVSGAGCSNYITPRELASIHAPFPSVLEYEIPAFVADSKHVSRGKKFLDIHPKETVYAIWIGTNDLGNDAIITDSQVKGKTIPDYIECIYSSLDQVYDNGGRYFVLMNLAPLQLAPQYATPENGGVRRSGFWKNKPENITQVSYRMWEQVATANDVFHYKTPFELLVARRYPGAKFAVMDIFGLLSHVYENPTEYFPGSASPNVTGFTKQCNDDGEDCVLAPNPESYMWFDELHPSERTSEIVAQEFVQVVKGESEWATYW
ncbi:GDSL lipase/acylhydrolase family protein [Aspergillus steynii IBT 23096]|uniref:GDSL lipase/acylhydrolase family protein n=1 Tax=Aspergillus steynii IBT 23096 TaxID=1392250 RepID=A0A2I2FRN3_9EURO|nr:GDSL lipase/acylhydrolase family protein [Aspergillus steynii IBT 23096]PLB43269.1 GDSL lipase/acylhydrolase family protein [Aspergillus steynii IBT 23096]